MVNLEVESNRTNFELNFIEFFEYFFTFRINRIANFRIESNEFRTNPISENLTLAYSWSGIERIEFKLIFIEFFEFFFALSNPIERISNEFQFDSNPRSIAII